MYTIEQGERIATVALEEGTTAVKFPNAHSVYGVKGDDLIVSLRADAEEGDDGTYNTADGDGQCLIAHYTNADTIYITGSGSCVVWGGQSPLDCPFKKRGKGGESGDIIQNDTPIELFGIYDDEAYIGDVAVIYAEYTPDGKESELHFEITAESTMQWRIYENDSLIRSGTGDENFAIVSPESGIYRIEGDAGMTAKIIPVY